MGNLSILINLLGFELSEGFLGWGCIGRHEDVGPLLNDVVVDSAHDNVKAEVLVAIHASCEELHVDWDFGLLQVFLSNVVVLTLHDNV